MFRKLKFYFPLLRFRILFISVFTCALFIRISIFAQVKPTPAGERMKSVEQRLALEKRSIVNDVKFRSIGPNIMSGRVVDVDVNPADPTEFYIAYATGGLWHTTNNGQSFTSIFDSLDVLFIGDIAVNWNSSPRIIWVGTGEVNSSRSSYAGIGIYKSSDNGNHWEYLGLPESHHALRVCIACIAGFMVAKFIDYGHHSYWVLLTIAFILKPAFSLTKQRNIQRIIGTFIGGAIGVVILTLTHDRTIHFTFLVLFMLGTYSFMRIKYLVMVICITPYILIFFSFIGGEYRSVIEERLLDTAIGCAIAFSASYFLFPSWEAGQLKNDMRGIVRANTNYLQKIVEALGGHGINLLDYKLARKDVYLSSANLSATFQRMLSEPKSKQGAEKDIHQFVVLNHILFSNTANLSAAVFSKEKRTYPLELIAPGKKAVNKLNEVRRKLGDDTAIASEALKKSLPSGQIETADDLLLKEQLDFIYNLAGDLEKTTNAIIG